MVLDNLFGKKNKKQKKTSEWEGEMPSESYVDAKGF